MSPTSSPRARRRAPRRRRARAPRAVPRGTAAHAGARPMGDIDRLRNPLTIEHRDVVGHDARARRIEARPRSSARASDQRRATRAFRAGALRARARRGARRDFRHARNRYPARFRRQVAARPAGARARSCVRRGASLTSFAARAASTNRSRSACEARVAGTHGKRVAEEILLGRVLVEPAHEVGDGRRKIAIVDARRVDEHALQRPARRHVAADRPSPRAFRARSRRQRAGAREARACTRCRRDCGCRRRARTHAAFSGRVPKRSMRLKLASTSCLLVYVGTSSPVRLDSMRSIMRFAPLTSRMRIGAPPRATRSRAQATSRAW